jgi:predicted  nucleic acid-binding Zn ribbon protein
MVAEKEKGKSELVVRFMAKNGNDTITADDIALLHEKFYVREVEGNSLEQEALAVACREVIKKHIVEPLSEIPLKMVRDINDAWNEVKDKVEPLLQGKFATCPSCGAPAMSAPLSDNVKFICPHCEAVLKWKLRVDAAHPDGGRYVLEK